MYTICQREALQVKEVKSARESRPMDYKATSRRSSILLGERQTTVFQRFTAKGIDLIVVTAVFFLGTAIWLPLGGVLAGILAALQDSFGNGQSIGKKIMGLRVIDDALGMSCSPWSSVLRNVPFVLSIVFANVPVLWALALFVSVPLIILEVYLILYVDCGVRLGDVMGNTLVTEHFDEGFVAAH